MLTLHGYQWYPFSIVLKQAAKAAKDAKDAKARAKTIGAK